MYLSTYIHEHASYLHYNLAIKKKKYFLYDILTGILPFLPALRDP